MATAITDRAEFDELCGLLERDHGLPVPPDVQTVEELIRYLLVGCKTKAAMERLRQEREDRKQQARQRDRQGKRPDAPQDDVDEDDARQILAAGQFSTGGDDRDAKLARKLVSQQEHYFQSPNSRTPAY